MSRVLVGTNVVSMDEPCWSLKEILEPSADSRTVRRVQVISVVRSDRVVQMRRDLGLASAFTTDEFCIPGGVVDPITQRGEILHTVGELIDIADYLRSDKHQAPVKPEAHNLVALYQEQPERRRLERVKQSTFSRLLKIQRD